MFAGSHPWSDLRWGFGSRALLGVCGGSGVVSIVRGGGALGSGSGSDAIWTPDDGLLPIQSCTVWEVYRIVGVRPYPEEKL